MLKVLPISVTFIGIISANAWPNAKCFEGQWYIYVKLDQMLKLVRFAKEVKLLMTGVCSMSLCG